MSWASDSKLACSVSNSGGLGIIGCGGRELEWVLDQIKYATNAGLNPIGLNVALADELASDIVQIGIDNGIKVFTMGGSNVYLRLLAKYGDDITIIPLVGNSAEAKFAARAGAKAIICEGHESGGSIGKLSLFALLPQVIDAVQIPVIAAGGISDSRGMKAAFALGASGIQMGTRFLASKECHIIDEYKKRIIKAKDTDSMVVFSKINRPTRVLKNKFATEYLAKEKLSSNHDQLKNMSLGRLKLATELDVDEGAINAGEGAGLISSVKSTYEIIQDIVNGFIASDNQPQDNTQLNDKRIAKYLQHKPPFLFLDNIIYLKPGIKCLASLSLDPDKWFFKCHYPNYPVMPGVLLIEAMSQAMVLTISSTDDYPSSEGPDVLLHSISNAKFEKEALPGMEIIITAKITSFKRGIVTGKLICEANENLICSCQQTIVIPSIIKRFTNLG
jgi:enoyl-[acyl-carrier protein] reductase II